MKITYSDTLKDWQREICYAVLRKMISFYAREMGFGFVNILYFYYTSCYFYFIKRDEAQQYNISGHGEALGYTYPIPSNRKMIISVYIDDIDIGYSYFTINEFARRLSHEFTHALAFHFNRRDVHRIIDDAIRNGTEGNLLTAETSIKIKDKRYDLFFYDIKKIFNQPSI